MTGIVPVARRRGFTLVELMVVISIIGILLALTLPAVQQSRDAARRVQCRQQLRQLGLALHAYCGSHHILPAGSIVQGPSFPVLSGWGWGAMLLPYIDQSPLYGRIDFDLGTAVGTNEPLLQQAVPLWRCPQDTAAEAIAVVVPGTPPVDVATGNYAGVSGVLGPLSAVRLSEVTDGLSHTLFLGERVNLERGPANRPATTAWCGIVSRRTAYVFNALPYGDVSVAHPINFLLGGGTGFSSRHSGGTQFTCGDGAVRFLSENIDRHVYHALGTPSGGEAVTLEP